MATPQELGLLLTKGMKGLAHKAATRPTGVTPGYHEELGGTVGEDGRITYVRVGAGGGFLIGQVFKGITGEMAASNGACTIQSNLFGYLAADTDIVRFYPPIEGANRFVFAGYIGGYRDAPDLWEEGDELILSLYVDDVYAGTIASKIISAAEAGQKMLPLNGALTIDLTDANVIEFWHELIPVSGTPVRGLFGTISIYQVF